MTANCELALLRSEIDRIDHELVLLLAKRFSTVDRVIATKKRSAMPAYIQSRVDEVIRNAVKAAEARGLPPKSVKRLWRVLVSETIRYEESHGVKGY